MRVTDNAAPAAQPLEVDMRAIRTIAPIALIAALLAAPTLVSAFDGFGPGGGHHHGMRGPGGPNMGERLLHMGCEIGLTDEQKTSIETILDAAKAEAEVTVTAMRDSREAWQESHDPTVFDQAAAEAFAETQAAYHADLMVLRMRTTSEVLSVLTPEQIEQLEEIRQEHEDKRGHRGGKRFGR
jgi:Spy/CpxP family protein refolding chaperone